MAAFAEAMEHHRETFGRDIRLYAPATVDWDVTLAPSQFDLEGIPLDPLASGAVQNEATDAPIAGLALLGVIRANVVFRPLQTSILRRDQTIETPQGIRSSLNCDLIIGVADKVLADEAVFFEIGTLTDGVWTSLNDRVWKVVNLERDPISSFERYIMYGQDTT